MTSDQLHTTTTAPSAIFLSDVFIVSSHYTRQLVIFQILQVVSVGKQPIYFQKTVYYCPKHKRKQQQKAVSLPILPSLFTATTLSKRFLNDFPYSLLLPSIYYFSINNTFENMVYTVTFLTGIKHGLLLSVNY